MRQYQPKRVLERGAGADLWRRTLSQIPTVFGRLVYLCSLRDVNTGRYEHFGLAQSFGQDEACQVLSDSHAQAFSEWLCLNLEQQMSDLDEYLSGLHDERERILETWIRLSPYRSLVPSGARQAERDLYNADLEALLSLLQNQHGLRGIEQD